MTKKVPIRTCVYTKVKLEKSKLIRLVKNNEDEYILDLDKKIQKRGIYIDLSEKTLKMLDKNKKFKISDNDLNKIKKMIFEKIKVGENYVK